MTVVFDMEIVITPGTTYMMFAHSMPRRIVSDGRDWPKEIEPTFNGYSIGKWIDTNHDGRYDVLETETLGLKGPRTYEGTGMPFHKDNQTVIKERLFLDKAKSAYQVEVHDLGVPVSPCLSWCSINISASAVMSASSNAPCRSSLSLLSRTSRSAIEVSDLLAPGKSCANRTCVQM